MVLRGRPCYKRPTLWHSKILVVHLPHRLHFLMDFYTNIVLTMYHYCSLLFRTYSHRYNNTEHHRQSIIICMHFIVSACIL